MQAKQGPVIWSIVIATVILLIVSLLLVSNVNTKLKSVNEKLIGFNVDVDEKAIADSVLAGIVMPEFEVPEYDAGKIDDVWSVLFGQCISDLEDKNNIEEVLNELDWEEVEEYLEDNLENFDEFYNFPNEIPDEGEFDEIEVEVTKIGQCEFQETLFNEDEDSEVAVTFEYDFKYEKDDSDKVFKDTLYVTGLVEYDEEGELEDVEVVYSL